jgi:hypothetical protein
MSLSVNRYSTSPRIFSLAQLCFFMHRLGNGTIAPPNPSCQTSHHWTPIAGGHPETGHRRFVAVWPSRAQARRAGGFHVSVTDRIAKTDILARASSGSASIHESEVVTIRGLQTILCLFQFLRDPLACAQDFFKRYGRLVVIEPVGGLPRRVTIVAVGGTYNRAIRSSGTW